MATTLSTDQFIALETWMEACAAAARTDAVIDTIAKRHRARQRAFTLLVGIEAPQPKGEDDDLA
jgi:hypothetical protein